MSICPYCKKELSGKTAGGHVAQCRRKILPFKNPIHLKALCEFCDKLIVKSKLEKHKINCAKLFKVDDKFTKSENKFVCAICKKEFEKKRSLLYHFWTMHTEAGLAFRLKNTDIKKKKTYKKTEKSWNKGLTKDTDPRIQSIADTKRQRIQSGLIQPSFKGKKHTEEFKTYLSNKRKVWLLKNKEKHNWRYKRETYPEKVFREWLIEQNIKFIAEYTPNDFDRCFAMDFAIIDLKLDVEINGEQHYKRNGEFSDYHIERQKYIESKGWVVINIKAYEIIKNFEIIKPDILKLLTN